MPTNDQVLVSCTNAGCPVRNRTPLLDLETFILIHTDREIPSYEQARESKEPIPCPACEASGREGTLLYIDDHLRKAPPDRSAAVPAVLELVGLDELWKRTEVIRTTLVEVAEELEPSDMRVPTGIVLDVRPYGGYLLRHGNEDDTPQYGQEPPGTPATRPRYIRELKHDLLYLGYYGDRERSAASSIGGVGAFEAMVVGAILALKFDLSFFYGVPTTGELSAATLTDAAFGDTTLDSFSGPIYFNPAAIGDNPIKKIYNELVLPVVKAVGELGAARGLVEQGLALLEEARGAGLPKKQQSRLRTKASKAFASAGKRLAPSGPKAFSLPSTTEVQAVRKQRSVEQLLEHPHFAQTKRKPWDSFARELRTIYALQGLASDDLVVRMTAELAEAPGRTLRTNLERALTRYQKYVDSAAGLDRATLDDLVAIVGGLPETFEPYLFALRDQATVDHGTAIYIKAVMSGLPIGSSAGKAPIPGRKFVYRTQEGGLTGQPASLEEYAQKVVELCKEGDVFTTPPLIMLERQKNESGFRATSRVGELALTPAERQVEVPMMGIDWSNWGRDDGSITKFYFSELFTNSVARGQQYPGYHGPIVHSRGVGGGQVTLPTLMPGVSEPKRPTSVDGVSWVSGIPLPAEDGTLRLPLHWTGAAGSIERAKNLLRSKFPLSEIERECTFDRVPGGRRYDCAQCLSRFDLEHGDFAAHGGTTYRCTVDSSRWPELFGAPLLADNEQGRREFPCSWLMAVLRYAGKGDRGYNRILKTAREIVSVGLNATATDKAQVMRVFRAVVAEVRAELE